MARKWLVGLMALVLVAVAGYFVQSAIAAPRTQEARAVEVVEDFYGWYLDYIGQGEIRQNPLVDGAYREREDLTDAFIGDVDEALVQMAQGGFDPFLLAQDVPERIEIGEATVNGDAARVTVLMYWGGNPEPSERTVHLSRTDGAWKIAQVAF